MAIETQEFKVANNKPILRGTGMLAIGGLISLATYTSGGPVESHYVMAALVLVGTLNLGLGYYRHSRSREQVQTRLEKLR